MVDYKSVLLLSMPLVLFAVFYMLVGFHPDDLVASFESMIFIVVVYNIIYYFDLLSRSFLYAFMPCFLFIGSYAFFGFAGFLGCSILIAIVLSILRSMNKLPKVNN